MADNSADATSTPPGSMASIASMVKTAYLHWRETRTIRLGAGLAYYSLFAIVPLVSLAAALVARLLSKEEAQALVADALGGLVEGDVETVAAGIVDSVAGVGGSAQIIGTVVLVVTASFLFIALQDALNVIWEAPVRVGFASSVRRRFLALGLALAVALFFASSLILQAVASLVTRAIPGENVALQSLSGGLITVGTWLVGIGTIALIFRVLPYAHVAWRSAAIGGVLTGVLVGLGTSIIGLYVSRYATTSVTGAAASVVLFLVWVYYLSQIVLGGAVLTKVLDDRLG